MSRIALALGIVALAGGLVYGAVRVVGLEVGELERASDWAPLSPTPAAGAGAPARFCSSPCRPA